MAVKLFGFEISRPGGEGNVKQDIILPSPDDGVQTVSGGAFGTYVDQGYASRNEADLIKKYREISMHPECEAAIDDMMQVQFGDISVDDPMINTKYNVNANQNLAFAEGEAEYFSVNVYIPTVTKSWAKPFDGPQDWTQRISDNKEMFTSSRSSFHIGTGFNDALTKMESSGWRANPVGELTFEYFITTWCKENGVSWCKEKDVSTHNAILNLWKETETLGFSKAFENATGHRWSRFVCDMEDHYQVNGDNKCVENEKNNQGHLDPLNTL